MLAVVASLASWYFRKYQDMVQVKNNNLNQLEITEQETLIGNSEVRITPTLNCVLVQVRDPLPQVLQSLTRPSLSSQLGLNGVLESFPLLH